MTRIDLARCSLLATSLVALPVVALAGPRVAVDGVNAIPATPYTSPYEDLALTAR